MSQSYLEGLMSERERILFAARQHWFLLVSSIFLEIILILIFLAATVTVAVLFPSYALITVAVGFALILIPVATMTRDIMNFSNHQYIITNRRVIHLYGILEKTITDSSLEKVNDIKMTQSALGRIFDYGDIEILTASELGVNLFKRIDGPVQFKTAMLNAKSRLEGGEDLREYARAEGVAYTTPTGPSGIPALIAQLDSLRQHGVLTEQEFQQKKTELLAKLE